MNRSDDRDSGTPEVPSSDGEEHGTRSELSGAASDVVQARDVHGGVHFHGGRERPDGPLGRVPRELPADVRGFVNRVAELERLDRVMSGDLGEPLEVSVLVIAGTAGVGKTSLALHWAHRVRERFPDGQLYVNLRGYDSGLPVTPEEVLDRFLHALNVPPSAIPVGLEARAALYRSLLAERRMLLVLDNANTAAQVRPLLPGADGCLVVVTSRDRLSGLAVRDGAERLTLDVFTEPESVALLRTVTIRYRAEDDAGELAELARLCARLPLALRIAAERAARRPRMLLEEMIADLRDDSGLWEALSADDEEESGAVRTVFAWSYRALPEDAARLFRQLGLHPGPDFSDHAAAALAGMNVRQVRHPLDVLVGAHLLEQTAPDRYQLHDLLRAYATDQAHRDETPDDCRETVGRVLTWYLHTAAAAQARIEPQLPRVPLDAPGPGVTPLAFPGFDEALRWYEAERANLVAATRAAADIGRDRIAWQLPVVLQSIYIAFNPFEDWLATSSIGLDAARRDGDRGGEIRIFFSLGMAYMQSQRPDQAAEHLGAALAVSREIGDTFHEARALNLLGVLSLRRRDWTRASSLFEQGLAGFREVGDPYWETVLTGNLGEAYLDLGRLPEAAELIERALTTFRELGDRGMEGNALRILSVILRELDRPDDALETAREAVSIARDQTGPVDEAYWLLDLGRAELALGRPGEALVSFQRSASLERRLGDRGREAEAWDGTGEAYQQLGRHEEATAFHRLAAKTHRELGDHWQLALSLDHLATALDHADAPEEAPRHRREALAVLADFDDPRAAHVRNRIGEALGDT